MTQNLQSESVESVKFIEKTPTLEMLRLNFPDLAKSLSLPEENALSNLLAKSFNQSLTQGMSMFFYPNFISILSIGSGSF